MVKLLQKEIRLIFHQLFSKHNCFPYFIDNLLNVDKKKQGTFAKVKVFFILNGIFY